MMFSRSRYRSGVSIQPWRSTRLVSAAAPVLKLVFFGTRELSDRSSPRPRCAFFFLRTRSWLKDRDTACGPACCLHACGPSANAYMTASLVIGAPVSWFCISGCWKRLRHDCMVKDREISMRSVLRGCIFSFPFEQGLARGQHQHGY